MNFIVTFLISFHKSRPIKMFDRFPIEHHSIPSIPLRLEEGMVVDVVPRKTGNSSGVTMLVYLSLWYKVVQCRIGGQFGGVVCWSMGCMPLFPTWW